MLEGKVALVTGADGVIGTATALRFAREGAMVVLNDTASAHLDRVATEIVEIEGTKALIALGDVTRPAHVERILREAMEEFGRVDILVNAAATLDGAVAAQSTLLCANAVLPGMRARRWGRVITTAQVDGTDLVTIIRTLAVECAADGITVNCVVPGFVVPPSDAADEPAEPDLPVVPMGRAARAREIAAAHVFFASDEASYVTGQVLYVDGGLSVAG
jgi:NAD(P)-dependent dehydrogenase (short-subunit alcohol dehydrogenase family)